MGCRLRLTQMAGLLGRTSPPEEALEPPSQPAASAFALPGFGVAQPSHLHHAPLPDKGRVAVPGVLRTEEGEDVALLRADLLYRVLQCLPPQYPDAALGRGPALMHVQQQCSDLAGAVGVWPP